MDVTGGVIVGAGVFVIAIVATGDGDKSVATAVFAGIVSLAVVGDMPVIVGAGFAVLHPIKLNKIKM